MAEEAAATKKLDYALKRSMTVKFMVEEMEKAGCKIDRSFFRTEHCDGQIEGGFRPPDGVVLCSNNLGTWEQIATTVTHELVHAYDHCRGKNLEWNNCHHHACSEIRAANLSGDCSLYNEFNRGNFGLQSQHQVCVKRRAELSVNMNANCKGRAKDFVEAVYPTCFKDTAPFERIP